MTNDDLRQAAREFGTPLYVYDIDRIRFNIGELRDALGQDISIHYAAKALDNQHILNEIRELGCGVDAVSVEEMQVAVMVGFDPADINFTPSGAHFDEYRWAVEQGINIHVDNPGMLRRLGEEFPGLKISLRINPSVRTGGHKQLEVGADDSKFGLFPEEYDLAHSIVEEFGLNVTCVHVHAGSDIQTEHDFRESWAKTFKFAERYSETVDTIDLGGGFGVQYFPGDPMLNLHKLGRMLDGLREDYQARTGKSVNIMLEPGKSIVGNSGFLLMEVTASKSLSSRNLLYVNSGFNHMIRPMYYGAKHRFENLARPVGDELEYKVVGYLCETDTFSETAFLPETSVGDVLCMHNAGAYAMTMASNYNSRVRPAEVMFKSGKFSEIRRRETLEDILWTQTKLNRH